MKDNMSKKYPEVEIDRPSMNDVRCLMDSYSGMDGELTAILQYAFQSYIMEGVDDDLAEMILKIAIVEMEHHELLGTTISRLGGTPVMGGNRQFWNGAMVNYAKDPLSILDADIRSEQTAIDCYKRVIRCVDNYSIKELIESIIEDEEEHLAMFREAKATRIAKK